MKAVDSMSIPFAFTGTLLNECYGAFIQMDAEESFHLSRVLRLRANQKVILTDGFGYSAECEISEPDSRSTVLKLVTQPLYHPKREYSVHIAIAPTKHPDRLEWFIEKATEIGIDSISLIICEHSEKWNVKLPRINRLMISAMKQSQQYWLPVLNGPVSFTELLHNSSEQEKWIGYCDGNPELLTQAAVAGRSVLIAIGPEGDFSPAEVDSALKNGFNPISLGPSRLRTETAGLAACLTIHTINNLQNK